MSAALFLPVTPCSLLRAHFCWDFTCVGRGLTFFGRGLTALGREEGREQGTSRAVGAAKLDVLVRVEGWSRQQVARAAAFAWRIGGPAQLSAALLPGVLPAAMCVCARVASHLEGCEHTVISRAAYPPPPAPSTHPTAPQPFPLSHTYTHHRLPNTFQTYSLRCSHTKWLLQLCRCVPHLRTPPPPAAA